MNIVKIFLGAVFCGQILFGMEERQLQRFPTFQLSSLQILSDEEMTKYRNKFSLLRLHYAKKKSYTQSYTVGIMDPDKDSDNGSFIIRGTAHLTAGSINKIIKANFKRTEHVMMWCKFRIKERKLISRRYSALLDVSAECNACLKALWRECLLPESPDASEETIIEDKVALQKAVPIKKDVPKKEIRIENKDIATPVAIVLKGSYYQVTTMPACIYQRSKDNNGESVTQEAFIVWSMGSLKVNFKDNIVPKVTGHLFVKVKNHQNREIIFWIFPQETFKKTHGANSIMSGLKYPTSFENLVAASRGVGLIKQK